MGRTRTSGRKGAQFWDTSPEQRKGELEKASRESSYWRKTCDLCEGKAIYRWGRKAVCRAHKGELEADIERSKAKLVYRGF